MGSDPIFFCRTRDEYGCFSNVAPYPVHLQGERWPISEHTFEVDMREPR